MKVCYRRNDGLFCDAADSWTAYPGDEAFVSGSNVIGRLGGQVTDFVVIDTDDPEPHLMKYVGGVLVKDTDKVRTINDAEAAASAESANIDTLKSKVASGTATLGEVQELLAYRT